MSGPLADNDKNTQHIQQHSPFLKLPPGIRNRVYECVFYGRILRVPRKRKNERRKPKQRKDSPDSQYYQDYREVLALPHAFRKMHHEAYLLPLRSLTFDLRPGV
jgi:hypothetical protein